MINSIIIIIRHGHRPLSVDGDEVKIIDMIHNINEIIKQIKITLNPINALLIDDIKLVMEIKQSNIFSKIN